MVEKHFLTRLVVSMSNPNLRRFFGFGLVALALLVLLRLYRRNAQGARHARVARAPSPPRSPRKTRVTCLTNNILFSEASIARIKATTGTASQIVPKLDVLDQGAVAVLDLARHSELYVITQCESDEAEAAVQAALQELGVFDAGLNRHRVLFCEKEEGRIAIARQLDSELHFDDNVTSAATLQRFLPQSVLISSSASGPVESFSSLELFLSQHPLPSMTRQSSSS
mmetsp:Transcript_6931/g.15937  ORF Transcript_6931/g.15937 Transcript_6931/m.15937 type:complete len:226 (-) Transcript_6931:193-870(-)